MPTSLAALLLLLFGTSTMLLAQSSAGTATETYIAEYYYKVKWGHQEEFLMLFRKNHLPVLKKQMESGRIQSVEMITPRYHMTESARWDYRVTIVFKNAEAAMQGDSAELIKQLYPDQATFKREEQRRFEILGAHWDVPVTRVDLNKQP